MYTHNVKCIRYFFYVESGEVVAPSSEVLFESVYSQAIGIDSADELVTCTSWHFLKQHNIVMPRTVL